MRNRNYRRYNRNSNVLGDVERRNCSDVRSDRDSRCRRRRSYPTADALEDAYNAGFNDGFCEGFEEGAREGCEDTKEAALNCIRRIRCV
jgi:hypothetical protein